MDKKALILGVTSQDGSYLSELLLKKDYKVIGLKRRCSTNNLWRLHEIINNPNFELITGDVTDYGSIFNAISQYKPNEIYNLAAMSFVAESFNSPSATFDINIKGSLNILECIKNIDKSIKYYFAGSSEMFGSNYSVGLWNKELECMKEGLFLGPEEKAHMWKVESGYRYQDENTPFSPQSPYGISKVAGYQLTQLYRKAYELFACNGILFNHESSRRGEEFVTRKIIKFVKKLQTLKVTGWPWFEGEKLKLGNLHAQRDWGYAPDYVKGMWMMLQQESPGDYVLSTGETHSVEDFLVEAFSLIGEDWHNFVEIDESLKRPSEVPFLRGDSSKAKMKLGWTSKTDFPTLVRIMLDNET